MSAASAEMCRLVHVICVCRVYTMLLSITLLPLLGLLRDIVLALYHIVYPLLVHISPHLCFSLFCCPHASLEDMDFSRHSVVVYYFPFVCLRLLWLPTCYDGLHAAFVAVSNTVAHCYGKKTKREATPLTGKTSNATECRNASGASVVLVRRAAFLFYAFLFRVYRRSSQNQNVRPRVSRSFVWCMLLSLIAARLAPFVFVFNSVGRSSR